MPPDLAQAYATHGLRELAAHYGVGYRQVRSWLKQAGIPLRGQGARLCFAGSVVRQWRHYPELAAAA